MASPNVATLSVKARDQTTTRSLSTHLGEVINVKGMGAKGNNSDDDTVAIQDALNLAFGTPGAPHGDTATSNRPVFFPPGTYKITAPLTIRSAMGGYIYGAGRHATYIKQYTANASGFVTNGFEYGIVERLTVEVGAGGTGICFDLDWDNTGETALQSNTFRDCAFGGGAYGISIGKTGYMGSENTIQNCYFNNHNVAGLATRNANALQQTVLGGNFASSARGIYCTTGSVMVVSGVGFQGQTIAHIQAVNSAGDNMMSITGCRTENIYPDCAFVWLQNGVSAHVASCAILESSPVFFIEASPGPNTGPGVLIVDGCVAANAIFSGNGTLYLRGNLVGPRAITGAANNGSGLVRLTMVSTAGIETGMRGHVTGVLGATGVNGNARVFTKISGTQLDIQGSTFGGTYTSGGLVNSGAFANPAYLSTFNGYVAQNI